MAHTKKNAQTEQVLTLMFEMGRMIRQACIAGGDLPMPFAHLETVKFVQTEGNPSMRDVAKYLRITAPSATQIVEDLVSRGLLKRTPDPKDRRMVRLSLSPKGKTVIAKNVRLKMNVLRGLAESLNAEEEREFARLLSKLVTK